MSYPPPPETPGESSYDPWQAAHKARETFGEAPIGGQPPIPPPPGAPAAAPESVTPEAAAQQATSESAASDDYPTGRELFAPEQVPPANAINTETGAMYAPPSEQTGTHTGLIPGLHTEEVPAYYDEDDEEAAVAPPVWRVRMWRRHLASVFLAPLLAVGGALALGSTYSHDFGYDGAAWVAPTVWMAIATLAWFLLAWSARMSALGLLLVGVATTVGWVLLTVWPTAYHWWVIEQPLEELRGINARMVVPFAAMALGAGFAGRWRGVRR